MRSLGNAPDSLKAELVSDYNTAQITDEDKLILGYAKKITLDATSIDRAYVDFLKIEGLSDRAIHDIVQVTAYFNYVNRLADALGVELEG